MSAYIHAQSTVPGCNLGTLMRRQWSEGRSVVMFRRHVPRSHPGTHPGTIRNTLEHFGTCAWNERYGIFMGRVRGTGLWNKYALISRAYCCCGGYRSASSHNICFFWRYVCFCNFRWYVLYAVMCKSASIMLKITTFVRWIWWAIL